MKGNDKQLIIVGFLSNVFEWYDFSIYAYMAPIMGALFFFPGSDRAQVIKAFFLFSISYLVRPIGSFVFGYFADHYARRSLAIKTSLIAMAIPTAIIALLPTYDTVGVFATTSLITLRLIQGFAAGGELPLSACYMYESSSERKRTFYCSFVAASSMLGVLIGSLSVMLLYWAFTAKEIMDGVWRIPFLVGIIIAAIVIYFRKRVEEPVLKVNKQKVKHNTKKSMFQVVMLNSFISVSFYLLFVWMPSYLHVFLNIPERISTLSNTVGMAFLIAFTLFFGYYADSIGKKKLVIFSILSILIFSYPLFDILNSHSLYVLFLIQVFFSLCLGAIDGVNIELITSRFHDSFRAKGASLGFTLPTAIFGGMAPTICSVLINKTGYYLSPVLFLVISSIVALPAALSL